VPALKLRAAAQALRASPEFQQAPDFFHHKIPSELSGQLFLNLLHLVVQELRLTYDPPIIFIEPFLHLLD
jgi:hypothetical protein